MPDVRAPLKPGFSEMLYRAFCNIRPKMDHSGLRLHTYQIQTQVKS